MRVLYQRLTSREDGASAILIALAMVVLLGFAALAIDAAGVGFNERRQDQSAADVGALAAVQFAQPVNMGNTECTGLTGLSLSRCNGAVEARTVANATLDDPSQANWADSSLCSTPPAGYTTVSVVSDCIAFNSNNQRAWVRIPTITNNTWIAGAIGIDAVSSSADAIAGTSLSPPGGVLPFLSPGTAAGSDYNCLKAGSNPKFGPCKDLPAVGNFGSADFFLYGNEDLGYSQKCNGDTNGRLVANIARGIDHPIGRHPTGSGSGIEEEPNCPDFNAEPNMLKAQPGNGSALEQGLLYGDSAYSPSPYNGRIEDSGGYKVRNSQGSTPTAWVNDVPLWSYLDTSSSLDGTPCDDATVNTPVAMEACVNWAKSGPTVVFNNDLVTAQRYGWVPQLWESSFGPPATVYHIKDYLPVYLDTTYYECNANSCFIQHTPGVADSGMCPNNPPDARITCGTPGGGNRSLNAISGYVLSQSIVPDNAKTPAPGSVNQRNYNLVD